VLALNVAQVGRFAIVKVSASLSASAAVGWNAYAVPCFAFVAGVPLIVGGRFVVGAVTLMANAGRAALALPSLTLMTMPAKLPVVPVGGVPVNAPVCMLKVAQAGLPAIANVSGLSSGSEATRAPEAVSGQGQLDTVRYGSVLRARRLVGVRGSGFSYNGLFYVKSVTHEITKGSYTQSFRLSREGTGSLLPLLPT